MSTKFTNNASSKLTQALTADATSMHIQAEDVSKFPVLGAEDFCRLTIVGDHGDHEIVKITSISSDGTCTIERAQEDTTAKEWPIENRVELRITAEYLNSTTTSEDVLSLVSPIKEDISNIKNNITNVENDILNIENKHASDIEAVNSSITAVQEDIENNISVSISNLEQDIINTNSSFEERISSVSTDLNSSINNVKEDLTSSINSVNTSLSSSIETLKEEAEVSYVKKSGDTITGPLYGITASSDATNEFVTASWVKTNSPKTPISNSLNSTDDTTAASSSAIKAVNDKLIDTPNIKNSLEEIESSSDGYYWYNDSEGGNSIEGVLPLGHFFMWPYSTPPEYAIIVNGAEYSRELYSSLWTYLSNHPELVKLETEWQSIASQNNGYCPYFSTGDGSLTFRVPKFAPYQQIAISSASAGLYHQAGLPDHSHILTEKYVYVKGTGSGNALMSFTSNDISDTMSTSVSNASSSNSVYGNSTTVQPESNEWVLCVVALGRITNTGSADVSAVMQAIGVVQSNPNLQGIAHLRESWKNDSGGWYRIYSDRWCEQGGTVPYGQNSVTFYKPFIDMNFYINAFSISKNNTDIKHSQIIQDQITNESFNLYVVSYNSPSSATPDSNYYYKWEAKGFIKE